ncbi:MULTISPECIES: HepT-like ribonuclease domain-containing protein [Methanohalophilus]|jgi:uncharacterized protein with HEPN domain|uniref:DUF86 domain-containing protein n=1 Tax=Methanohalophilus euhalobius TaxID=51203 RepID=A0A285G1D5_9EURY|nr:MULTISPECIES: DUF86 domain-containing protein [Methanohalophilus]KXS40170.1 MAG: hypothetical protein AWU58_2000 [Methanohalophilus sp. T328-1]RSD34958.1 MAG: hypothetical protein CI952_1128 [Methanohalophilus sp.]ODV49673.1 MAG: hypothetical protein A8273_1094 [Methanohalophilus sp. 2-GBenrich]PQV42868.1 uncharacterized protein with HEPN domain [Methanohalophilus euhalobius]RNI10462.1 DUF86 domain-containing protein [Methanohalophilus euhalobius]
MKNERQTTDYFKDILYAMDKVGEFTGDLTYWQFIEDEKTQFAVIRAIEVIGEATKNIPESIKTEYPSIPWRNIAGMRDKMIHAYFGIDMDILWKTATEEIPQIEPQIMQILHKIE